MVIEIRARIGGDEAVPLVREQLAVYVNRAKRRGFRVEIHRAPRCAGR